MACKRVCVVICIYVCMCVVISACLCGVCSHVCVYVVMSVCACVGVTCATVCTRRFENNSMVASLLLWASWVRSSGLHGMDLSPNEPFH